MTTAKRTSRTTRVQYTFHDIKRILLPYFRSIYMRYGLPTSTFVIFGQGRSGSTLLMDLLNNHPDIFCDAELFLKRYYGRVLFAYWHIKNHSKSAYILNKSVYGFKVKVYQFFKEQKIPHYVELLHRLHVEGWKFIHVRRRNVLKQCLSNQIREYYSYSNTTEDIKAIKIPVDCDRLLNTMDFRTRCNRLEDNILRRIPHLSIRYEDDLLNSADHQKIVDKIFGYLGVPSVKVEATLKKMASDRLADNIENYDEFYSAIMISKYASYLQES